MNLTISGNCLYNGFNSALKRDGESAVIMRTGHDQMDVIMPIELT